MEYEEDEIELYYVLHRLAGTVPGRDLFRKEMVEFVQKSDCNWEVIGKNGRALVHMNPFFPGLEVYYAYYDFL